MEFSINSCEEKKSQIIKLKEYNVSKNSAEKKYLEIYYLIDR